MPLAERGKPQFYERLFRKLRVRVLDAERTLGLNALGKELIVHILHDHVGALHSLFWLLRFSIPKKRTGRLLMQTAERAGEGRFPRAVMADDSDDVTGRGLQRDSLQNRLLLIRQGHVPQLEYRRGSGRSGADRAIFTEVD